MNVIKKNLYSILFGVVAILAVVAVEVWPIPGLYTGTTPTSLTTELTARVAMGKRIDGLLNAQRQMPVLDPDQTTPKPLAVFPSDDVRTAAVAAVQKVHDEAKTMVEAIQNTKKHDLLYAGELPNPNNQTVFKFAEKYAETVAANPWMAQLHATGPVTDAEVAAEKLKVRNQINAAHGLGPGMPVLPGSAALQKDADSQFATIEGSIRPQLEAKAAQTHWLYADPAMFSVFTDGNIVPGNVGAVTTSRIWAAQVYLWLLDDICNSITTTETREADPDAGGGAPVNDILHDPIKRIEHLGQPQPAPGDKTKGVNDPIKKDFGASPSGRTSNGMYTLYRFDMDLVVDAAKLQKVLHDLQAGGFITVTNVQMNEVSDPAINLVSGSYYGDKPVVRVHLDCEILMMRSQWMIDLMPDAVKAVEGIPTTGTPAAPAPAH